MYRTGRRGSIARPRHPYLRPSGLTDRHHGRRYQSHQLEHQLGHPPPHVQAASQEGSGQCQICSNTQPYPSQHYPVFHQHYSSQHLREILNVEVSGDDYHCPSCRDRHKPFENSSDDRIKVVVSDILHQVFATPGYRGDRFHMDYVTIKGGYLPDLLHAFRLDYSRQTRPIDVVLVAGYSDLLYGYNREYIMDGYKEFANVVLEIGQKHHPDVANTVAIATLMYPPKLCWFRDNGPEPYNYRNEISKIDDLNHRIERLNNGNSIPIFPGFHSYGTRKTTINTTDEHGELQVRHVKCHRWEHWQETARRDKFTMRPDRLIKMAVAVNNYFAVRTGI